MVLSYQAFQPRDSQLRILGEADNLLIDEKTDSISSALRKEIEGKIFIKNDPVSVFLEEGKDS